MSYFGAVSIILAVYMIWREYSSFLDGELRWCRCYLKALEDYRDKVKCYMQTPTRWAQGYTDAMLSECGFLERLSGGEDIGEAYRLSRPEIGVSGTVDAILSDCFERLGEGYLDTEIEVLESAIGKLSLEEKKSGESLGKKRKAAGALLGAFASGVVILVI